MNFLFRILLTFNATSLLVIIYLVQKGISINFLFNSIPYFPELLRMLCVQELPKFISYLLYLAIPISFTKISIFISSQLGKDEFKKGNIQDIEHANNSFLPSYLGYFFVALSINSHETLIFVYIVLFVFTFLSQALYFNPLFLLFGYDFYNIKTKNGNSIFLISRHQYKTPSDVNINLAYRINNFTFIERD